LNGKTVSLSDYRGRIVFLNFWATWCIYCREEMPDLNEVNRELLKGGDAVIITVDVQESLEKVKDYMENEKLDLPVLLDSDGKVAGMYGVEGYPTTFVIKKDGTVYGYKSGIISRELIMDTIDKIR